jgi:hypothetical protein
MAIEYRCANCGRVIEEGQFIALIGQAPASGLSTPLGRADKLFAEIGHIYGRDCFLALGTASLVQIAAGSKAENE